MPQASCSFPKCRSFHNLMLRPLLPLSSILYSRYANDKLDIYKSMCMEERDYYMIYNSTPEVYTSPHTRPLPMQNSQPQPLPNPYQFSGSIARQLPHMKTSRRPCRVTPFSPWCIVDSTTGGGTLGGWSVVGL